MQLHMFFGELWALTDHIRCEFEMMSPHPATWDLQETSCVCSNGFQMNQSVLKLSAKTIEREHWVGALRYILSWELMCHSVMLMDSTHHCRLARACDTAKHLLLVIIWLKSYKQKTCWADWIFTWFCISVMARPDTVGVWTVMDRREQEPEPLLEHNPQTVTAQVSLLSLTVSTIWPRGAGSRIT